MSQFDSRERPALPTKAPREPSKKPGMGKESLGEHSLREKFNPELAAPKEKQDELSKTALPVMSRSVRANLREDPALNIDVREAIRRDLLKTLVDKNADKGSEERGKSEEHGTTREERIETLRELRLKGHGAVRALPRAANRREAEIERENASPAEKREERSRAEDRSERQELNERRENPELPPVVQRDVLAERVLAGTDPHRGAMEISAQDRSVPEPKLPQAPAERSLPGNEDLPKDTTASERALPEKKPEPSEVKEADFVAAKEKDIERREINTQFDSILVYQRQLAQTPLEVEAEEEEVTEHTDTRSKRKLSRLRRAAQRKRLEQMKRTRGRGRRVRLRERTRGKRR